MGLTRNIQVESRSCIAIHIRVHGFSVDRGSLHAERTTSLWPTHLGSFFLRALEYRRQSIALRRSKRRLPCHSVAVGEHRCFVLRGKGSLDRGEAVVHLL